MLTNNFKNVHIIVIILAKDNYYKTILNNW